MMTLIAAALAAAAPAASTADAPAHQQHGQTAQHQMMDCCKEMKADCKDCCKDMDGKHAADGSEHSEHAHQ
jgi:hypothetical protein